MVDGIRDPSVAREGAECERDSLCLRFADWARGELVWYAASFTVHLLALATLLLLGSDVLPEATEGSLAFSAVEDEPPPVDPLQVETVVIPLLPDPEPPPVFNVDPTFPQYGGPAVEAEYNDGNEVFQHRGGGTRDGSMDGGIASVTKFNVFAPGDGAKPRGFGGISVGYGEGTAPGSGGAGTGLGHRGQGSRRRMLGPAGATQYTEVAATGALHWIARHQLSDGSWSLDHYTERCKDGTCTGKGVEKADAAATALGLLPFLGAGQTHKSRGPYQRAVAGGLNWLIAHQKPDGDLAAGSVHQMYTHGLAAIALCEAYALTGDRNVGIAAQGAVNFIVDSQHKRTGGWRYHPGDEGDTSVVGWQIMALKSAQMAGLSVSGSTFDLGGKWLDSVAAGPQGGRYCYQPVGGPSPTMTSVGLLCRQYLGTKRSNPMMTEGVQYLLENSPDPAVHNIYYWYYATQVLHNMSGYEWDTWNRKMRRLLAETQCRDTNSCANGSWAPEKDQWGKQGGRLMVTSLATLTLEIYYRYLPLFKPDAEAGG